MRRAIELYNRLNLWAKFMFNILLTAVIFVSLFGLSFTTRYDKFVMSQRSSQLQRAFLRLQTDYSGDALSNREALEQLEYEYGLRMLILTDTVGGVFNIKYTSLVYSPRIGTGRSFFSANPVRSFIDILPRAFGDNISVSVTYENTDPAYDYLVFNVQENTSGVGFIGLLGRHNATNDIIMLQLPTPIVQSAVDVTRVFLLAAGSMSLIAALLLALPLARRLSSPIVEINRIAERMADLDFSLQYTGHEGDEIGALGSSVNRLSGHLQRTIAELVDANHRLEAEVERAHRLDEMRKNLLINVSHELKTPLALVQGYAEGLRINIDSDDESRAFYCGVIEEEARHMTSLVSDLLSLSRIEAGAIPPEPELFSIDELAEACTARFASVAEAKGVALEVHPVGVQAYADRDMIERALLNFLSNALDHTPEGGVVRLYATRTEGRVRLSVFNSGEFINEDELPRIWQSFYKLDKARTRSLGGTGIGLSIVKAVMEAHHCAYGAHNEPIAGGVVFWFDLPLPSPAVEEVE